MTMAVNLPIITEFDGKGINKAVAEFKKLETKSQKAGFLVKKAFLPATAAIGGLAVALGSATQAAMEDAAAQDQLALTLRNVTGASQAQIDAVEKSISAMTMATGIADDQLRPAFEALTRGTKDISLSMRDMTLVTDIATATNKPLVEVADALAKAYQGNFRGLQQLSPEMKTLIKDGADLDTIMSVLGGTFGGATETFANTAQGGLRKFSNGINEAKESIGAALLPALETVLPYVNRFAEWAQKNPKVFLGIAGAIAAVAASIVAVNIAMALNPFHAIALGIGILVAGLVVAYNKFDWFRKAVNTLLNFMLGAFENFANGLIGAVNIIITGLNFIPGVDIPKIPEISLPRIGEGGAGMTWLAAENRGSMPTGGSITPSLPDLTVPTGAGSAAGTAARAAKAVNPLADMTQSEIAAGNAAADFFSQGLDNPRVRQEITVNINGGMATANDIAETTVNALRQYNQIHGPIPVAVA